MYVLCEKKVYMNNKYTLEGTYQINNCVEKEFEISFDIVPDKAEKTNKLFKLLNHPWRLIKEGGRLGIKGIKRFTLITLLFAITNTFLFFYSINQLFSTGFGIGKLLIVFLILILGLGVTVYAAYRTYQYIVLDTIKTIYEGLSSLFQKILGMIIEKVDSISDGRLDLNGKQLNKAMDFGKMLNTNYKKIPKILRRGIVLILNRIPLLGMIIEVREDIVKGNKIESSTKLYTKMDAYITDSIFGNNNTNWVYWLLPANVIVIFLLIMYKIG